MKPTPPTAAELAHLKPGDSIGLLFVALALILTGLSIFLSSLGGVPGWLAGQFLLAIALLQWFVLLHECGHGNLFKTKWLHTYVGHLASFFSFIPFHSWRWIHSRHHKWTGWQDLDPTTASLVPRELGRAEKLLMNVCWKYWIPLFSILYRLNIFWNPSRLRGVFHRKDQRQKVALNSVVLVASYGAVIYLVGFGQLMGLVGLGILLNLVFQDPLLLSQHTHVPLNLSQGDEVQAYPAVEQEVFTRSLKFPGWFSTLVLLNFDAHELHHMYPFVPGYYLNRVRYSPHNEMHWWQWIRKARQIPGQVFLFQNRNTTGHEI